MLQLTVEELNRLCVLLDAQSNNYDAALAIKLANEIESAKELDVLKNAKDFCKFEIVYALHDRVMLIKLYRSITGCGLREAHDYVLNQLSGSKPLVVESNNQTYERAVKMVAEYSGITIKK